MKYSFLLLALLIGCANDEPPADAYGNYEADETTVSTRASGELMRFVAVEGALVSAGDTLGYVDTTLLHLQRADLQASLLSASAQRSNISAQIALREREIGKLRMDEDRIMAMYADKAATQKQVDDVRSALDVAMKGLDVLRTQFATVDAQVRSIDAKQAMLDQSINDAVIVSPVNGTILSTFVREHEIVGPGKPLFTIADLTQLNLRAYVAEDRLNEVKYGQEVTVTIDMRNGGMRDLSGTVAWISSRSEFTPKTIQTRDERVGQVYAMKVRVKNDGSIKIGMPGEVRWTK